MATTTNYAWETPDDTDLVKDGAAAIRTLGSSIDTTTKALNPSTTLGDIEYRSSTANTNTRLGIGSNGQYLTVSGGVPAWAAISAGGMTLISTTTLTGSSVTLSSIPQTYRNLYVVVRNFDTTVDYNDIMFRFNGDTTANRHREIQNGTTTQGNAQAFNATRIGTNAFSDDTVVNGLTTILFEDYANTTTWKKAYAESLQADPNTPTSFQHYLGYGYYNQTDAITSLDFFPQAGSFAGGTLLLYGVQ